MSRLWGKYVMLQDGSVREMDEFLLQDGYLFMLRKLCISRTSLWDFLSCEIHAGCLARYFGQNKTIEIIEHRFYWPSLKKGVAKIVSQYCTCQVTKQQNKLSGLSLIHI